MIDNQNKELSETYEKTDLLVINRGSLNMKFG